MSNRLFVGGLPWATTPEDLATAFSECGTVVDSFIVRDKMTGRSRGFGFVTMETDEQAQAAIARWNEQDFGGRKLMVNVAQPREENGGGERRSFGGPRRDFGGSRGGFGGGRGGDSRFQRPSNEYGEG